MKPPRPPILVSLLCLLGICTLSIGASQAPDLSRSPYPFPLMATDEASDSSQDVESDKPSVEVIETATASGAGANIRSGRATTYNIVGQLGSNHLVFVNGLTDADWASLEFSPDQITLDERNPHELVAVEGEDGYLWYLVRLPSDSTTPFGWTRADALGQVRIQQDYKVIYPSNYLLLSDRLGLTFSWQLQVEHEPYPGVVWLQPNGVVAEMTFGVAEGIDYADFRSITLAEKQYLVDALNQTKYLAYQYGFRLSRLTPAFLDHGTLMDLTSPDQANLMRVDSDSILIANEDKLGFGKVVTRSEWEAMGNTAEDRPEVWMVENTPVSWDEFWAMPPEEQAVMVYTIDETNNGYAAMPDPPEDTPVFIAPNSGARNHALEEGEFWTFINLNDPLVLRITQDWRGTFGGIRTAFSSRDNITLLDYTTQDGRDYARDVQWNHRHLGGALYDRPVDYQIASVLSRLVLPVDTNAGYGRMQEFWDAGREFYGVTNPVFNALIYSSPGSIFEAVEP